MGWWFKIPLWARVLAGMALGVIAGFVLREQAANLKIIGDIFVRLIRLIAAPIIFVSVIAAIVSVADLRKLGMAGARIAALYIPSGFFACLIGIGLAVWLQPGAGATAPLDVVPPTPKPPPTANEIVAQFIPDNPVAALANGDMLAVIVTALLFGMGLLAAGERAKPAADVIEAWFEAMQKLTGYIMELAPFGAFALMAWVVGAMGFDALAKLAALVGVEYLGCLGYMLIVYGGFIRFVVGLPALPFFRGMGEALAVAYATASSNATLPVTMRCMIDKLGVSRRLSGFVAALGATVNMDGTALHMAIVAIFGAQLFGVPLDGTDYVAILFTATIGAIGAAGIPGGSLIFLPITLGAIGVPLETIAVILGVDRLMDMMRTTTNVLGDSVAGVAVAKWQRELDETLYRTGRPGTAEAGA